MKNNVLLAFTALCCYLTVSGQSINTKKLDDYFNLIADNDRGIGAIVISQNGKHLYNRQFGQERTNPVGGEPSKHKYQIGSVTKMLTATMIFQLVDRNKLKLDEKLYNYFPQVPNAENITISHLLNHTSGLGDFVTKDDSLYYWLKKPVAEADIFSEIKRQGSLFQPGTETAYSNTGYYLLARILEKKYNKDYKAILNENIIKPLGLTGTRSINKNDKVQDIATPYMFLDKWKALDDFYFPNVVGVGDVVSMPEDMNAFLGALFAHKLISRESLEEMKPAGDAAFGKGLMRLPFYNQSFYGHMGDTFGTHTISAYNPADKITYTIMLTGMELDRNDYLMAILSIVYNMNYSLPDLRRYSADLSRFSNYEGLYRGADFPLKLKVFTEDNVLTAQATGQPAFSLEAMGEDKFRFLPAGLELEFKNQEKKLILTQGGQTFILDKE